MPLLDRIFTDGRSWCFHILGFIFSRDSFRGMWEVIQPAEEGKLEVSYRWFRSHKQAEAFCLELSHRSSYAPG